MIPVEQPPAWPQTFHRRVATVKAWQVTDDNLAAAADWCGGHTWARGVVVPIRGLRLPGESSAHPGDWIVREGADTFRVLSDAAFQREYVPVARVDAVRDWQASEATRRAGL